jgi:hypothetical protein
MEVSVGRHRLAPKLSAESIESGVNLGFLLISAQIHLIMDGYQVRVWIARAEGKEFVSGDACNRDEHVGWQGAGVEAIIELVERFGGNGFTIGPRYEFYVLPLAATLARRRLSRCCC